MRARQLARKLTPSLSTLLVLPGATSGLVHAEVTVRLISSDVTGLPGDAKSGDFNKSNSANGQFVAFVSEASNLVPEDSNGSADENYTYLIVAVDDQGNRLASRSVSFSTKP